MKITRVLMVLLFTAVTFMPLSADDGRFCFGPGQVQAAVYAGEDGSLDIYAVDNQDQGFIVAQFTPEELADTEDSPEAPIVMLDSTAEDNGVIDIAFYKLPSNEWQINAGPNYDSEVFACIFNDVPDFDVRIDTFHLK